MLVNQLLYEIVYIDMIMTVFDMKSDHVNKNTIMFDILIHVRQ